MTTKKDNNNNNNNNDNDGKRKWQQPFDVHNRGKRGEDVDDIEDKDGQKNVVTSCFICFDNLVLTIAICSSSSSFTLVYSTITTTTIINI